MEPRARRLTVGAVVFWLCVLVLTHVDALGGEAPPAPQMPAHWKVVSDFQMSAEQVNAMGRKLDAALSSVRNTVYDVNGKRIQINTITTPDSGKGETLMAKLRSMKADETLLRKERTVYEFVGPNEVLSVIAEGRAHLDSL